MIEKDIKYRCPNCRGESLDLFSGVWYCVLCNYHLKDRSEIIIEEWISKDSLLFQLKSILIKPNVDYELADFIKELEDKK